MEPLSITCDTCNARLKVRDAAAIGQILMCPKCQSMVLVEAPESWSPPADNVPADDVPADDVPVTADAALTEVTAPPLPEAESGETAADSATSFDDEAIFDEPPVPSTPSESKPSRKKVAAAAAAAVPVPPPVDDLPDLAMPAATTPWAKVMATSAGRWSVFAAGSLAVVLVGVIAWSVMGGDPDETEDDVAAQQDTEDDSSPKAETPAEPDDAKPDPEVKPKRPAPKEPNPFAPKKPTPPEVKPDPKDPNGDNPFDNGPADERPEEPDPVDPIVPKPPVDPKDDTPEKPVPAESSEDLLAGMDLLDEGELFGLGSGFSIRGEAEPDAERPAPDDAAKKPDHPPSEKGEMKPDGAARPKLADIDIDAALKMRLLGVQYNGIRLTDFAETTADVSRVPITLDLDALEPLKLGPSSRLTVQSSEATVGDLLASALKGLNKRLVVHRDEHGVTIAPATRTRALTLEHIVLDLADKPADRESLIELIERMVLPGTWKGQGGNASIDDADGTLKIEHTMQAQYQIIVLLEKLRTAASKPSKNKFYDVRTFDLQNRHQRAAKRLAKVVKANHVLKQPLAAMVRRLEWAAGTNIAVDWAALREENIGRDTPVRLIIDARTLAQAMDEFLEPLGLAWRVHDASTLQISTKAEIEGRLELEVYGLKNVLAAGLGADALVAQLRRDTDPKAWESDGGRGQLHVDTKRGCLLVLANQTTQNTVGQILARLREQNLARRDR